MPTTNLVVISDLHLADGHSILEGFRLPQQSALAGLLRAALPGGALGTSSPATLVINGDCFDFLAVPPYLEDGQITPQIALAKLTRIANVHQSFFAVLREFLVQGGTVVFLPGNHDIELCFQEVRDQITRLIDCAPGTEQQLQFVLDQAYRPLFDVSIEHGSQYDVWNYAAGIWDEEGKVLTARPERILHPLGTQYMHRAALPLSIRYPYFDHFDPPIGITRQIALLSLLDPELVVDTARRTAKMLSFPHVALQNLAPGEERQPELLFAQTMLDFALFQGDMLGWIPAWRDIEAQLYTPAELAEHQSSALAEVFSLQSALQTSAESALTTIFQPIMTPPDDGTTRGMHALLRRHPELRVAIAGHTHTARRDLFELGGQVYLNTASWTIRYIPPLAQELTAEVIAWLRQPELEQFPLQDRSGAVFALVSTEDGQPSTACLCVWEGGEDGNYRQLDV